MKTKILTLSFFILFGLPLKSQTTTSPQWISPKITCEISKVPRYPLSQWPEHHIRPTHNAVLTLGPEIETWRFNIDDQFFIAKTPTWNLLSDKQKKLINDKMVSRFWSSSLERDIKGTNIRKFSHFILFAMSEKDACLMSQAFVKFADDLNRRRLEDFKKEYNKRLQTIAHNESEIPKLKDNIAKMKIEIDNLQKVFHYAKPELAFAEFVEMDKLVRLINIELAGLNARIAAVKQKIKETSDRADLYRFSRDQDIELAGLLNRKKAAEENRDQAKKYYDILKQVESDEYLIKKLECDLKQQLSNKKADEKIMSDLPQYAQDMQPPFVIDNKAIVYPIAPPPQPGSGFGGFGGMGGGGFGGFGGPGMQNKDDGGRRRVPADKSDQSRQRPKKGVRS